MADDIFKKGLITDKKEKLHELKTIIKGYKESFDIEYLRHKFHPEKMKVNSLKTFAEQLIKTIEQYQELSREIEEL